MDLVTHYMPMTHEDLGWPFIMLYFFFYTYNIPGKNGISELICA